MPYELDKILISSSQPDFEKRMRKFRSNIMLTTRFATYGSKESKQVIEILRNVAERGDQAVAEYTEKFDEVKLTP